MELHKSRDLYYDPLESTTRTFLQICHGIAQNKVHWVKRIAAVMLGFYQLRTAYVFSPHYGVRGAQEHEKRQLFLLWKLRQMLFS